MKGKFSKAFVPFLVVPFMAACNQTAPVETTYKVTFDGNSLAYAIGLPEEAKAGEEIQFKVTAESGYEITKVEADAEVSEVTLAGSVAEGFTFTMPEEDVEITATALGAYFKATLDGEKVVWQNQPESPTVTRKQKDFVSGFMVDGEKTTGTTAFLRAGSEVKILGTWQKMFENVAIYVDGEAATQEKVDILDEQGEVTDSYNVYAFTMPNHNPEIEVSVGEEAELHEFNINVTKSDDECPVTWTLKNDAGEEVTKAKAGENVHVEFALPDEEKDNWTFKQIRAYYNYVSGYSYKETTGGTSTIEETKGSKYKFQVSTFTQYAGDIELRIEFAYNQYAGKEFVGTYKGANLYGTTVNPYYISTTFTLNADGTASLGGTSATLSNLDETAKTLDITATGSYNGLKLHYDTNIMWVEYPQYSHTDTDIYVAIKNYDSSTMNKKGVGNFGTMAYFEVTNKADNSLVANFMRINGTNYLDVEIEFYGEYTEVTVDAAFYVKKNGVVVAEYNIPTGEDLSFLTGTWVSGSHTMVLDGDTQTGTWNGSAFTFIYNSSEARAAVSGFGAFDASDNYFTFDADAETITIHLDDEYGENPFSTTLAKQA